MPLLGIVAMGRIGARYASGGRACPGVALHLLGCGVGSQSSHALIRVGEDSITLPSALCRKNYSHSSRAFPKERLVFTASLRQQWQNRPSHVTAISELGTRLVASLPLCLSASNFNQYSNCTCKTSNLSSSISSRDIGTPRLMRSRTLSSGPNRPSNAVLSDVMGLGTSMPCPLRYTRFYVERQQAMKIVRDIRE